MRSFKTIDNKKIPDEVSLDNCYAVFVKQDGYVREVLLHTRKGLLKITKSDSYGENLKLSREDREVAKRWFVKGTVMGLPVSYPEKDEESARVFMDKIIEEAGSKAKLEVIEVAEDEVRAEISSELNSLFG